MPHDRSLDWRLLQGGVPREILARITEGDPLGLQPLSEGRLHAHAYLIHPDRLAFKFAVRAAFVSALERYAGDPPLAQWLDQRLEETIEAILQEDTDDELCGNGMREDQELFYSMIAENAEVSLTMARRIHIVFNNLDFEQRLPFYRIVVEGVHPQDYAESTGSTFDDVLETVTTTMSLIMKLATEASPEDER